MKVLIVDDDVLIREGLKILLELEDDIEVCGMAGNGREALEECIRQRPDIVLMDIRMPETDGIQGTRLIKEHDSGIKVVMLTTFLDEEYIVEAIKNGAEGYVLKNRSSESMIESLRAVFSGSVVFDNKIAGKLGGMVRQGGRMSPEDYDLTENECRILALVAEGDSNREIAGKLFLSEGTVRNYISKILLKLDLRDRTQLAVFYLKNFE